VSANDAFAVLVAFYLFGMVASPWIMRLGRKN
jgi:hypothetical protein